jgi:hypothetical protein
MSQRDPFCASFFGAAYAATMAFTSGIAQLLTHEERVSAEEAPDLTESRFWVLASRHEGAGATVISWTNVRAIAIRIARFSTLIGLHFVTVVDSMTDEITPVSPPQDERAG